MSEPVALSAAALRTAILQEVAPEPFPDTVLAAWLPPTATVEPAGLAELERAGLVLRGSATETVTASLLKASLDVLATATRVVTLTAHPFPGAFGWDGARLALAQPVGDGLLIGPPLEAASFVSKLSDQLGDPSPDAWCWLSGPAQAALVPFVAAQKPLKETVTADEVTRGLASLGDLTLEEFRALTADLLEFGDDGSAKVVKEHRKWLTRLAGPRATLECFDLAKKERVAEARFVGGEGRWALVESLAPDETTLEGADALPGPVVQLTTLAPESVSELVWTLLTVGDSEP